MGKVRNTKRLGVDGTSHCEWALGFLANKTLIVKEVLNKWVSIPSVAKAALIPGALWRD
jgi:hypothetical protein